MNIQGFSRELQALCRDLETTLKGEPTSGDAGAKLDSLLCNEIPEALHYIAAGVSRMDLLLAGLLRFSRLGKAELSPVLLDMGKLLQGVLKHLQSQINQRSEQNGLTLEVGELPPCNGDRLQIEQLFANLLDNALKYLRKDRPGVIKVAGYRRENEAVYVVEDNGIGIAPEHCEKIFSLFYRLNPAGSDGEGLGLTIARKVIERHQGRIWVESVPGEGSRFFVSLPAAGIAREWKNEK